MLLLIGSWPRFIPSVPTDGSLLCLKTEDGNPSLLSAKIRYVPSLPSVIPTWIFCVIISFLYVFRIFFVYQLNLEM